MIIKPFLKYGHWMRPTDDGGYIEEAEMGWTLHWTSAFGNPMRLFLSRYKDAKFELLETRRMYAIRGWDWK
jgi:hypothetical protein